MIRIAAVDDHPLFLDGVLRTLATAPDFEIVASGTSAADAVRIAADKAPDIMVLDMSLPAAADGIAAVEGIVAAAPSVRILILTVVADDDHVMEAIRKGACGYVLKGIGGGELVDVARTVHRGETYIAPTLAAPLLVRLGQLRMAGETDSPGPARLGQRETQVLSLIAQGFSNKEIGLRLVLSDKTVKHYITGLLRKMHVRNRTEAAIVAARWQHRAHQGPPAG